MRQLDRVVIALLLLCAASGSAAVVHDDLSVAWISRTPKIDYVWESSNPTVEGWPAEGAAVTWVAHVRWLGATPRSGVAYRWLLDGQPAGSGTVDFAAGSLVEIPLPWIWTFTRHDIVFEIDPQNAIAEVEERNNRRTFATNALAVGIYVERTYWETFAERVALVEIGATTFDDWIQIQVRRFNEMAANAIFPETPHGVNDHWRVDAIHLLDDGVLPLVPPYSEARDWGGGPSSLAALYPNVADHSVDIQWGFPAAHASFWPIVSPWILTIGNSYIHEFAHARSMIDVYAWNLDESSDKVIIGGLSTDRGGRFYSSPYHGLMQLDWGHIDRYTAAAMNRLSGRRATVGNYNEPWDLGFFLNELPERNRVRFVRPDGTPLANATVRIYASADQPVAYPANPPYMMTFDAIPEFTLTADANGEVVLGRNPFSRGDIRAFVDHANGTAIVRVTDGATDHSAFLQSLDFNLAYWRGETAEGRYEVMVDTPPCPDQLGPGAVKPEPEELVTTSKVTFTIFAQQGHVYDLYYRVNDGATVQTVIEAGGNIRPSVTLDVPAGHVVWWYVDRTVAPGCVPQHSSIYAFDHLPLPTRPRPARRQGMC